MDYVQAQAKAAVDRLLPQRQERVAIQTGNENPDHVLHLLWHLLDLTKAAYPTDQLKIFGDTAQGVPSQCMAIDKIIGKGNAQYYA